MYENKLLFIILYCKLIAIHNMYIKSYNVELHLILLNYILFLLLLNETIIYIIILFNNF
jgi:hypothetical protein